MADNYSEQFIQALETHDRETLVAIPKSDLHNHIGRGCRKQWLSEKLNHEFADPPAKFDGLMGMQNWYVNEIRDYCREHDATDLRREGCFVEAGRNHLVRFAPGFAVEDIEECGSMKAFMDFWNAMHQKYCPDAVFEPELAFPSYGDVQAEIPLAEEYFASGFFHSIDVCCGEGYKPFDAFLPLYKIAEKNHVLKRMHVGESGTAEDVEAAVETLGLDEVHHGIHAATSPRVMKLLADRKITLNVCPTSNIMLGYANTYEDYPIKILVENGVPVTINTDDLLVFNSTIDEEYLRLYEAGTLTAKQLDEIRLWGIGEKNGTNN